MAKKLEANYISTCTIGDIIEIKTKTILIKNASVKLNQSIYKDDKKIFDMNIVLAFIKNGKLSKIEDDFLEIFKKIN